MVTESTKRALIIKIGAIGDVVMALPLARELRTTGYGHITWLAGNDVLPIIALTPEIDDHVILNERVLFGSSRVGAALEVLQTWLKLRGRKFDDIFLLHADRRYRLLAPPFLRSIIHTMHVGSRRHRTFDYARMAFPAREDQELTFEPYVLPSIGERTRRICLFPGGAKNAMRDDPLRRWPLESYVKLCELLLDQGLEISIVGGPSDGWIKPAFAHLRSQVDWQVGTMRLSETIDFLRQSRLAISHDTGPVHLCSLADCPIITISGPTNSEWYAPLKYMHLVIERTPKLPCQPCYDGRDFGPCTNNICINKITSQQVAEKVFSALDIA
jgi:heptosyltransferase-2